MARWREEDTRVKPAHGENCEVVRAKVPAGMLNRAVRLLGFFSTSSVIDSVPGRRLSIVTGTTAPFSAISGVLIRIASEAAGFTAPKARIASVTVFMANAFWPPACAKTSPGRTMPAAISSASTLAPPPALSVFLRE